MKKILIIIVVILVSFSNTWADERNVILHKTPNNKGTQFEIPVHAGINDSLLGIHFEKASDATVSVTGPEGVVYQQKVTSTTAKSVYVNLAPHQEGEYRTHRSDGTGCPASPSESRAGRCGGQTGERGRPAG